MNELKKLSNKELIDIIHSKNMTINHQTNVCINKQTQIKHLKLQLKKIANLADYFIEHPYSSGNGFTTRKHPRDVPHNQKLIKRGDTNERVESSKLRNEASMAEDQEVI